MKEIINLQNVNKEELDKILKKIEEENHNDADLKLLEQVKKLQNKLKI